jgi:hypothetical protein
VPFHKIWKAQQLGKNPETLLTDIKEFPKLCRKTVEKLLLNTSL